MEAGRDDISSFLEADLLQQALREVWVIINYKLFLSLCNTLFLSS